MKSLDLVEYWLLRRHFYDVMIRRGNSVAAARRHHDDVTGNHECQQDS